MTTTEEPQEELIEIRCPLPLPAIVMERLRRRVADEYRRTYGGKSVTRVDYSLCPFCLEPTFSGATVTGPRLIVAAIDNGALCFACSEMRAHAPKVVEWIYRVLTMRGLI